MLNGVYVAALTPLREDLSCDLDEFAWLLGDMLARGCAGVVLFGTTGEGSSFSVQERLDALSGVIQRGIPPNKIVVANGSANIVETISLVKGARALGVTSVLIAPPIVYKPVSDEGVIQFYRTLIQKVDDPKLQILLYHIPQLTGIPITHSIVQAVTREYPSTIIGLKESEGNIAFQKAFREAFGNLQLFIGSERLIVEGMKLGASGAISGLANCYPELVISLLEAKEIPQQLIEINDARKGCHFIPAFKAVLEKSRGKVWRTVRPPLYSLQNR